MADNPESNARSHKTARHTPFQDHLLSAFGSMEGDAARGDLSQEAFAAVDGLHRRQWAGADQMITGAYQAMGSSDTWHAWTQYWLAQVLFGDLWLLQRACFKFFASGNVAEFDAFLKEERPGADAPLSAEKQALLDDFRALMTAGSEGVADQMFARIRQESWLPRHVFDWGNPQAHNADFSRPEVVGPLLEWGFTASPEALREGLFDFPMPPAMA